MISISVIVPMTSNSIEHDYTLTGPGQPQGVSDNFTMISPEFCAYNRQRYSGFPQSPFSGKRRSVKFFLYVFPLLSLCISPPVLADDGKQAKSEVFQIPYRLTATQHVLLRA